MSMSRSTFARPLIAMAMVVASVLCAIAQQPPTPTRVRGTIEGVDGDVIMVKSRSGEDVKLHMAADMKVVGIVKISLADIKLGSFIGTTTVPGADGQQNAVAQQVAANDGQTLMIKYKDGEKKVTVGPETPVVTYAPGEKSDLKAGAKVIAFIKQLPDGSFETSRISVGRDGLTPPM